MFIGENPSWQKNLEVPLGANSKSGMSLEAYYLVPLGLVREEVFVTNLFKCRYPKDFNKKAKGKEEKILRNATICAKEWLVKEIQYAKPKILVTLSSKEVFSRLNKIFDFGLSNNFENVVGKAHLIKILDEEYLLFPLVHPDKLTNSRNPNAIQKWLPIHLNQHIPKLKELLSPLEIE